MSVKLNCFYTNVKLCPTGKNQKSSFKGIENRREISFSNNFFLNLKKKIEKNGIEDKYT